MQMVAFRTPTVPPTVTSVSPNSGTNLADSSHDHGANFAAGATVTVGATAATNVVVVSATQITATTPVESRTGNRDGDGEPAKRQLGQWFTYVLIPTVTSVLPNSGATVADGSHDYRNELRLGSERDVRRYGGNQRGGGKRDATHATAPAGPPAPLR